MEQFTNIDTLQEKLRDYDVVILIATMPSCGVCQPLKEKIQGLFTSKEFSKILLASIDLESVPEGKGFLQVFTAPIVLVFVQGKEAKRYGAALDLMDVKRTVLRFVELMEG